MQTNVALARQCPATSRSLQGHHQPQQQEPAQLRETTQPACLVGWWARQQVAALAANLLHLQQAQPITPLLDLQPAPVMGLAPLTLAPPEQRGSQVLVQLQTPLMQVIHQHLLGALHLHPLVLPMQQQHHQVGAVMQPMPQQAVQQWAMP
jgi:hypothetical protein